MMRVIHAHATGVRFGHKAGYWFVQCEGSNRTKAVILWLRINWQLSAHCRRSRIYDEWQFRPFADFLFL